VAEEDAAEVVGDPVEEAGEDVAEEADLEQHHSELHEAVHGDAGVQRGERDLEDLLKLLHVVGELDQLR
jgi:hypothetical protein